MARTRSRPRKPAMPDPRVLLLFNEPVLPAGHPDADSEHDVLFSVAEVEQALTAAGVASTRLGVTDPHSLLAGLDATPFDVAFNLYEGTAEHGNTEAYVAGLLEWKAVPFTGSLAQPMILARNKPLAKRLLAGAGIPTAPFFEVCDGPCPDNTLGWPVIVKPGLEDASVGIDQAAVVTNDRAMKDRVAYCRERFGPSVLVEKFIVGREIHTTLVDLGGPEPTALPFAEIAFKPLDGLWPIYSYDAKWRVDSQEYDASPVNVPVALPPAVTEKLVAAARRMYTLLGLRDYARVDARVTDAGEVYVLEANPNPSITSIMLTSGLEAIGWSQPKYLAHLVRSAFARGGRPGIVPRAVPKVA